LASRRPPAGGRRNSRRRPAVVPRSATALGVGADVLAARPTRSAGFESARRFAGLGDVPPRCYRSKVAVRRKRSVSIPAAGEAEGACKLLAGRLSILEHAEVESCDAIGDRRGSRTRGSCRRSS
jgi:hypothetical protein